jgi:hypothetical protein
MFNFDYVELANGVVGVKITKDNVEISTISQIYDSEIGTVFFL